MRCALLVAVLMCSTAFSADAPKEKPPSVMQSVVATFKSIVWAAVAVPKDDGSARPSNDEARQPAWDEPSGRVPTRTERGRTCQSGDVSRFTPSPFADWLRMLRILK